MNGTFEEKKEKLIDLLGEYGKKDVMIAFSGGVDSSLLLHMACQLKQENSKVYAVTADTLLHPSGDLKIAQEVAAWAGAEHIVVKIDELKDAGISENPINRCYLCKLAIFKHFLAKAEEKNVSILMEGTNEDDLHVYRPGIQAIRELNVISPLAQVHMTKEEVKMLAQEYKISTANRPSTPCLATRFPYGTTLTYENMRKVETAENKLREYGCYNVRIRVHKDIARIEVDKKDMSLLLEHQEEIVKILKELGYFYVTLDLEGFRSGSMDVGLDI